MWKKLPLTHRSRDTAHAHCAVVANALSVVSIGLWEMLASSNLVEGLIVITIAVYDH